MAVHILDRPFSGNEFGLQMTDEERATKVETDASLHVFLGNRFLGQITGHAQNQALLKNVVIENWDSGSELRYNVQFLAFAILHIRKFHKYEQPGQALSELELLDHEKLIERYPLLLIEQIICNEDVEYLQYLLDTKKVTDENLRLLHRQTADLQVNQFLMLHFSDKVDGALARQTELKPETHRVRNTITAGAVLVSILSMIGTGIGMGAMGSAIAVAILSVIFSAPVTVSLMAGAVAAGGVVTIVGGSIIGLIAMITFLVARPQAA